MQGMVQKYFLTIMEINPTFLSTIVKLTWEILSGEK